MTPDTIPDKEADPACAGGGSSLATLQEELKERQTEATERERLAKRSAAQIEKLNAALDEIRSNVNGYREQRNLIPNWQNAVQEWRDKWTNIREELDCDAGCNCVAVEECVAQVDQETANLKAELCKLRQNLSSPLGAVQLASQLESGLAWEAYQRLTMSSINNRIGQLKALLDEAETFNDHQLENLPKVYMVLEAAREVVSATETRVTICAAAPAEGGAERKCADPPEIFEIPETAEAYEKALVDAFLAYDAAADKAAIDADKLEVDAARRGAAEEEFIVRLQERKKNLLAAAEDCKLAIAPPAVEALAAAQRSRFGAKA